MGCKVLVNQMKCIISNLESGEKFFLRDIIQNPPAQLGRTLYEGVQSGAIPNVEWIETVHGVERYRKL